MRATALPRARRRNYLPSRFKLTVWERLQPFYEELLQRQLFSLKELEDWLLDRSELDAFVSESFAWRYINISSDSHNKQAQESYQYAIQELSPQLSASLWNGLFVHKDTPADVRKKIAEVAVEVINSDRAKEIAAETGAVIYWRGADETTAQIAADTKTLGTIEGLLAE